MSVIVIGDLSEVIGSRTKVPIALVHDRSRAVDVLETVDGKAIVGIAKKRAVQPWRLDMIACGSFVVMILRTWTNGWSHMPTAKEWDQRCVHIVAFCL